MMIDPTFIVAGFTRNQYVVDRATEGLSHADSLLVPAFGGNCLNWVLGHITVSRCQILGHMGVDAPWGEDIIALYETGSAEISAETALPLEAILATFAQTTTLLSDTIGAQTAEDMAAITETERGDSVGQRLNGLVWHEAYHVGQLELLRRLAGKTEKLFG